MAEAAVPSGDDRRIAAGRGLSHRRQIYGRGQIAWLRQQGSGQAREAKDLGPARRIALMHDRHWRGNMRPTFVLALALSLGASAAMADTLQTCSIATGRSDGKMEFSWQRGDCKPETHCHEGDSDMSWS